jgi:hypothetical protein
VTRHIENGKNKADVCREFGLVNSAIQTICRNITIFISAFEQNGLRIRRLRKHERSDIDEALLMWFKQERSDKCTGERSSSDDNFCPSYISIFKLMHFIV